MEKPVFLEKLKETFSEIKEKLVTWIKENRKLAIIISALFSLMLICIILILIIAGNKKEEPENYKEVLQLTQPLVIPNGPELPRDYTISRETKENWTEEEGQQWFTTPTEQDIRGLEKANNNKINDILGAAP